MCQFTRRNIAIEPEQQSNIIAYIIYFTYEIQPSMEEDQEYIVDNEPLKVFSLFPKRQLADVTLTPESYANLYDNLTCTICRQLFKTPVYLKCSHRFCKDCIEKYIRSNTIKSCPNCRGELTTKRDLRSDYCIQSFIRFAFQDARNFTRQIDNLDRLNSQKSITELRRMESYPDPRSKAKELNEDSSAGAPKMKRTKTADGEEPKRRRRKGTDKPADKKGTPLSAEKLAQLEAKLEVQRAKMRELRQNSAPVGKPLAVLKRSPQKIKEQIFRTQKPKKKIEVIEIDSKSEHQVFQNSREVEEIRRQEFLHPDELSAKQLCSIAHLPLFPMDPEAEAPPIFSFKDQLVKSKEDAKLPSSERMLDENEAAMVQEGDTGNIIISDQALRAIALLKEQFGQHYQVKVIELSNFSFYSEIHLEKLPSSILTPELFFKKLKLNLKMTVSNIGEMVSEILNIDRQAVHLFVLQEGEQKGHVQLNYPARLYEVNEKYWQNWAGVEVVELGGMLSEEWERGQTAEGKRKGKARTIYYSVDFSKLWM